MDILDEVDAHVDFLLNGVRKSRRRHAFHAPKSQLLAQIEQLAGCPKCAFVAKVAALFLPDLSTSSTGSTAGGGEATSMACRVEDVAGGSSLVNLLQFSWGSGSGGGGRGSVAAAAASALADPAEERICLSESLLQEDQLLVSFLRASADLVASSADPGGGGVDAADCARHAGARGPAELDSTARRLKQQQQQLLAELEALAAEEAAATADRAAARQAPRAADILFAWQNLCCTATARTEHLPAVLLPMCFNRSPRPLSAAPRRPLPHGRTIPDDKLPAWCQCCTFRSTPQA